MNHFRRVLTLPFVVLALSMTGPTAVSAADVQPDPSAEPIGVEVPMYVGDIDAELAAKAGNKVVIEGDYRVLIDGKTGEEIARVPKKGKKPGDVSTAGVVYGNCGAAWFYLYDASGRQFYFNTGFDLDGYTAVDFNWNVSIRGESNTGVDNYSWSDSGPMWPDDRWTSGNKYSTQDVASGSWYYGRVTSGTTYNTNGTVCYSGYPSAGRYLYF